MSNCIKHNNCAIHGNSIFRKQFKKSCVKVVSQKKLLPNENMCDKLNEELVKFGEPLTRYISQVNLALHIQLALECIIIIISQECLCL